MPQPRGLVVALLLAFGLAACGSSSEKADSTERTSSTKATKSDAPADSATDPDTDEPDESATSADAEERKAASSLAVADDDTVLEVLIAQLAERASADGVELADANRSCIKDGLRAELTSPQLRDIVLDNEQAAENDELRTTAAAVVFNCLDVAEAVAASGVDPALMSDRISPDADRVAVLLLAGLVQGAAQNDIEITDDEQLCLLEDFTGQFTFEDFQTNQDSDDPATREQRDAILDSIAKCLPEDKIAAAGIQATP